MSVKQIKVRLYTSSVRIVERYFNDDLESVGLIRMTFAPFSYHIRADLSLVLASCDTEQIVAGRLTFRFHNGKSER